VAFLQAAQENLYKLNPATIDHAILSYLLNHAVGRSQAKPWAVIKGHLKSLGFTGSKETFQPGLLKKEVAPGVVESTPPLAKN